ncbi:MAG: hypothetical protein NVSMB59_05010 [Vulcanimicrobiaceae bacterium]
MTAADDALRGRREGALLASPSVRAMAETLARRCRDDSWVRTTIASLDRFATLTGTDDLDALLARARRSPAEAQAALDRFALALASYTKAQIAALALAPKVWFALNGVDVAWRPLHVGALAPLPRGNVSTVDRVVLLALVGSGLHRSELARVRLGDLGSLGSSGELIADIDADPVAVRFVQQRGHIERITFFSDQARDAIATDLARRRTDGETIDARAPLVATTHGDRATRASFARSNKLNAALIEAGNSVNVELCRTTGRFFRTWGLPGARFDERAIAGETS